MKFTILIALAWLALSVPPCLADSPSLDDLAETRGKAEQGDAEAQYNLGVKYNDGDGVAIDYTEAVKWWRKAADQGNAEAQFKLGVIYHNGHRLRNGHGVAIDYSEAVKWWHKAADQGEAGAQSSLGLMYGNGQGVPRDFVQAYMWLYLAAAQGAQTRSTLDYLEHEMTPDQIAEAKKLAAAWKSTAN